MKIHILVIRTISERSHWPTSFVLTAEQVTPASNRKIWWLLPYDDPETGRHYDFEWRAQINSRARSGLGCPYLSGQKVWPGFNDLATKYPELAAEWHPYNNSRFTPRNIHYNSYRKVWWKCPICGRDFHMAVSQRVSRGHGCKCGHKV